MSRALLVLILFLSCKNSPPTISLHCNEFESDVKMNWHVIAGSPYPNVTDTLLFKLQSQYRDCMIGKDSSYIINLLGRKYNLGLPGAKRICKDTLGLRFSLEYPMKTPRFPFQNSDGYEMQLLIDSASIVRCVVFFKINARGVQ